MTKEQTLRLAKAVKTTAAATKDLLDLAQEILLTEPQAALAISEPTAQIAIANEKLLQIIKKHFYELQ
jgi:hypothetical protein